MSTPKQTAANRQNSQKSTGPRSAQGKATSRANSLKTGLYARSQIIAGEDPAELRALADRYSLRWEPATPEESFLVATLVDSDWLLRRYSLADAKIWDYHGTDDSVRDNPNGMGLNFIRCRDYFPLLQRRIDSSQRTFHRALRDLERLQAKRSPATPRSLDKDDAKAVRDPPPEAKANFAQPQSAQQRFGFVPSFSPAPDLNPLVGQAARFAGPFRISLVKPAESRQQDETLPHTAAEPQPNVARTPSSADDALVGLLGAYLRLICSAGSGTWASRAGQGSAPLDRPRRASCGQESSFNRHRTSDPASSCVTPSKVAK